MEKRVAGIIRWLERCVKAYKSGAVESALVEAECARADIETLRGDLWGKLDGRARARRKFSCFKALEALFCAFGIMLTLATPLASQRDGPAAESHTEGHFTLEWITPDERELLSNVRKRPSDSLAMAVKPDDPAAKPEAAPVPALSAAPAKYTKPAPPQVAQVEQRKPETSLTYDSILSLIETGERAMKNEPPAIKVEITSGK